MRPAGRAGDDAAGAAEAAETGRDGRPGRARPRGTPVPLYVITGGRSEAEDESLVLDLVTLVVSRSEPDAGMLPEHAAILRLCRQPLSVAEISAHLELPFSAVVVLLGDLLAGARVEVRQTRGDQRQTASDPGIETLKALIDGLQRL